MPQMSPLWWLTLAVMFNLLTMMTMSMMYFNLKIELNMNKSMKKNKLNWKW
uniref:ATP synthase F0 subunit 8 n=1 Tax=Leptobelus gazella TaxID=1030472 RepID=V9I0Q5_LEPGZ|nr:ATP synthase F0 subunit 8 [Leptobelus gazella]AEE89601.1 ATP synthase F0 subunit 8 [Leptobelus gazella]